MTTMGSGHVVKIDEEEADSGSKFCAFCEHEGCGWCGNWQYTEDFEGAFVSARDLAEAAAVGQGQDHTADTGDGGA